MRALILFVRAAPSRPNHVARAPSSNTIMWDFRLLTCESGAVSGGHKHSYPSKMEEWVMRKQMNPEVKRQPENVLVYDLQAHHQVTEWEREKFRSDRMSPKIGQTCQESGSDNPQSFWRAWTQLLWLWRPWSCGGTWLFHDCVYSGDVWMVRTAFRKSFRKGPGGVCVWSWRKSENVSS